KYDAKVTLTGKGNLGSINGDLDIGLRIGRDGKVDGTFKAEGFGGIKGELAAKVELLRDGKAVAALNAGAHGTLGAERSLEGKMGLKGGKFYAHGDVSGAFGVGGGAKFGVEADVIQAGLLAKDVAGHYGQAVNLPGAIGEIRHQAAIGAELDKQVRFNAGQVHGQEAANRVFGPDASETRRLTGSLNTLIHPDNFAALDPNRDGRVSRDDLHRAQDNASLPDNVRAAANTLSRTFPTVSSAENGFNYFTQRDLDRVRQSMGLGTLGGTR
ncbi:MAG TPA: hypothetical protein VK447_04890, partial [Myxococcaceae bacterium]|nr:hypothetical protein [Myxococcaceae bacterium]